MFRPMGPMPAIRIDLIRKLKLAAYENRLPDMAKTIKRLEKELAALKEELAAK